VFSDDAQREGAYDFLENEHVDPQEMMAGLASATVRRCAGLPFVFVPVDGTSLTVSDWGAARDFGCIGSAKGGARGLKVIDALAVDPQGVPVGLLGLTWWARPEPIRKKKYAKQARPLEEKETRHWVETIRAACSVLDEKAVRGWFQIDREGDGCDLLLALTETKHWWTVRANADRSVELEDGDTSKLRTELEKTTALNTYRLQVVARPERKPRLATMVVRTTKVVLRLRDQKTGRITPLPVTAVWAREQGTTPAGEDPIDWLLYTNRSVETLSDATLVIDGYAQRWRVEEFHRAWKAGDCDVESTQLRSFAAVQRWAIILAAVAVRIERLKRLARTQPDRPAAIDLSAFELHALLQLKFDGNPPSDDATIGQAVAWLAELGGYANKYAGKPPGATVLGRGLKYLRSAARLLELQHAKRK
jgi:hypothetical protein